MTRLANCPFCGGDDSVDNAVQQPKIELARIVGPHGKMSVWVQCACGAQGRWFDAGNDHPRISEEKAIAWWNARYGSARHMIGSGDAHTDMLTGSDYAAGDGLAEE